MYTPTDRNVEELRSEILAKHPEHFYMDVGNILNEGALVISKYPDELIDSFYPELMSSDVKYGWYLPRFREIFRETYMMRKQEIRSFISDAVENSETPVIGTSFEYLLFSKYNQEHPGTISSDAFIKLFESEAPDIIAKNIYQVINAALKFNPRTPRELIKLVKQGKNGKWMFEENFLNRIITDEVFSYITAPLEQILCGPNQSLSGKMYLENGRLKNPWEDYRKR